MNIFATDKSPIKSAEYLWNDSNRRGIKMILESCQLLCTSLSNKGIEAIYKPTHRKHPCAIWVDEYEDGFDWVSMHCKRLAELYTEQFKKIHKSEAVLKDCIEKKKTAKFKYKEFKNFVNCARNSELNLDFTNVEDVHIAYIKYLAARKNIANANFK